jgi:hypothetical protein
MPGIRRRLEPALLLASEPEFLAQALDPVHSNGDTMIGQVPLQSLGATGFPRSTVCGTDLQLQARFLL